MVPDSPREVVESMGGGLPCVFLEIWVPLKLLGMTYLVIS